MPTYTDNSPQLIQFPSTINSNKPMFLKCEICDCHIKNLEELYIHLQLSHKENINLKMVQPPFSCPKCSFRFFTVTGLERHLLGSHGLVTINDSTYTGKNGGR